MFRSLHTLALIAQIAVRNLFASRLKTIIVGGIIFFSAALVVVGTSVVDSIDRAMRRSVVGSVAGHIQVYSARSKDDLVVMGGFSTEGADLAPLDDFAHLRAVLLAVPHVKAVVPMGISGAVVSSGNTIDVALDKLRETVRRRDARGATPAQVAADQAAYQADKGHVRQMIRVIAADFENARKIREDSPATAEAARTIALVASDTFWAGFDADPLASMELLENRLAPLAPDADLLFLRYVGTDPGAFSTTFERMRIVEGQPIPRGKRGFLFSKYVYEDQLKLKTAHRLDKIKEAIDRRGKTIAGDPELARLAKQNSAEVREILLQLDEPRAALFRAKLQTEIGSSDTDVGRLLAAFFLTDDANFARRYAFFYEQLAPSLELYRVRVGDTLVIRAFARSGYVHSTRLRVYGTFAFRGLESSALAGSLNLMDMVSFRDLYGFLTAEKTAEIAGLRASAGARDVERDRADVELLGDVKDSAPARADAPPEPDARLVEASATPGLPALERDDLAVGWRRDDLVDRVYDPAELGQGVVLDAAVILDDPNLINQTIAAIEAAGSRSGLPLKAISWQKASGFIGQVVGAMHGVLFVVVLIMFSVALVIINNALVMATLERVPEIGTLRAVGAQRRFVVAMLVVEALAVGLLFGGLGAALGAAGVAIMGKIGVPAWSDIVSFFFSGPRLFPTLGGKNVIVALVIVFLVSAMSSLYPAWLAMRVTPRQAMQTEE